MSTEVASLPVERKVVISNRLAYALSTENLPQKELCVLFNIPLPYISCMKNQALFKKVPEKVWRRFNRWEESGDTLEEYAEANHLMDGPALVTKTEALKPTNGEVKPKLKKGKAKLVDLRVTGMEPTNDLELIQTRIDSLMKAVEDCNKEAADPLVVIKASADGLKKLGYKVNLSIELK